MVAYRSRSWQFAKYVKDLRLLQGQINNLRGQSTPRAGARESSIANSFQHRQQHKRGMDSKHIECLLGGVFLSSPWSTAMLHMKQALPKFLQRPLALRTIPKSDHIWFHGPQWLNRREQHWPTRRIECITREVEEEEDCFAILSTMVAPFIPENKKPRTWPIERICSYDKLKRIVAYSLRFIRKTSKGRFYPLAKECETFDDIPNAQEMIVAERHLL
ncbi:unnamed protein product [Cylicocyclus nassatus]|uniref:Uncharacterized protein n=1 Tax=Cylicocyclus nassatus TaxID=53992 RepID=A0AA36M1R0_CYLNA|nr:unnamed protein product [Cylicocyclus nassatus]